MAVPKIRFPGFTEDWEQRKFEDVFEEYSEKNHEELPPLTIIQGQGTIRRDESDRALQYDKSSLHNYKMVNVGDFILHLRSFEGGLEVAKQQGIISPAYHTFHGKESDSRFYYPFFRSYQFINVLLKPHVFGIRDGKSIDVEGMKKIEIPYPSYEEQKQLGDFFDQLDKTITLHQRKLESMKLLKKSLLQKMFPKSGETVPEVRFTGFTDAWEQRKLGEFADIVTGKLDANAMKADGKYDFYTSGIQKYRIDVPAFEGPAITIAGNGATVGYMHLADGKFNAYQRTYVLSSFKANREFLFFEIGNKLPQKIAQEARTGNIPYIVKDMLTDLVVSIPSELEQKKIGAFFLNLDSLITLHQRKVEALQKLKKSLLQQMFV